MTDRFNTIAGWVLFSGIVALGLSSISSHLFEADKAERPETMGYPIEGVVENAGAEAEPDLGTLLAAADPVKGEKVFAKCTSCHTIDQGGANGIGPNLYGTVGEPIGKGKAGFAFSSALSEHGGDWTYENLFDWLHSPKAFAAGTKMSFAGLSSPEDRANVIAYLKANGGGPAYPEPKAPEAAATDAAAPEAGAASGVEGGEANPVEAANAVGDEQPVASDNAAVTN